MSKNEDNPIPPLKPRKQRVLTDLEAKRHAVQVARIERMSENTHLGRRAIAIGTGVLATIALANGISNKVDSHSTTPKVDIEQEGSLEEQGLTTVTAEPGDGYEVLVIKEAKRSGLTDSEIKALPIQDLTFDAKELNGGQMVHPNVGYVVPDIPDKINQG